jgi:hypothetical protein
MQCFAWVIAAVIFAIFSHTSYEPVPKARINSLPGASPCHRHSISELTFSQLWGNNLFL